MTVLRFRHEGRTQRHSVVPTWTMRLIHYAVFALLAAGVGGLSLGAMVILTLFIPGAIADSCPGPDPGMGWCIPDVSTWWGILVWLVPLILMFIVMAWGHRSTKRWERLREG